MFKEISKRKIVQPFLFLLLGFFFLFLSKFSLLDTVRFAFSYIFEPFSSVAHEWQGSVTNWGSLLLDASSYIEENRELKEEILEIRSSQSNILNVEEYEILKKQKGIIRGEDRYVLAKVLGHSDHGEIFLNVGIDDGVKEGDIVSLGNVFLGIVSTADKEGALVKLPISRDSSFEVAILPATVEKTVALDGYIKSKGVITGNLDGIRVENIGINSEVVDGDIVILRDERVGEILVVGRVIGLSKNPASTSKTGFVSPIYDFVNLISVFVKVD